MLDLPDEGIAVAGVRGPLSLQDALFMAGKACRIAPVQVLRTDRVVSLDQLRSAAWHAHRAFRDGRNQADRLEVEFTRYVAGERQIKKALQKIGLRDENDTAILVALGDRRRDAVPYFLDGLGLREDDGLLADRPEALAAYVTDEQRAATPAARHLDLVLEAVAAVDTFRK